MYVAYPFRYIFRLRLFIGKEIEAHKTIVPRFTAEFLRMYVFAMYTTREEQLK